LFFFIFAIAPGSGSAMETVVHPGQSIQVALNDASEGDIITVKPGIYYQYVEINKDNLTLRSAAGPDETFIFGTTYCADVIQVIANNATIDGFSVSVNATTKDYFNNNNSDVHGICLNSNINNCVIENNNVTNTDIGINLNTVKDFTVKNNEVSNNGVGINLFKSDNNLLTYNLVHSNDYGIKMQTSTDNLIYNNSFNNTINAEDNRKNSNKFNITTFGNYWSDYKGEDVNPEDGIGDTPYAIDNKNRDYRPLMNSGFESSEPPVTPETPAPYQPVAAFTAEPYTGTAPLTVYFTDNSENATSIEWDLDGDGIFETPDASSPAHTYEEADTYTVTLKAINGTLNNITTQEITVNPAESPINPSPIKPVAAFEFETNLLMVNFTDCSENATTWLWDFGDGSQSDVQNPTHTYTDPGNYTVNLTVSNENGTDWELATIEVLAPSEPSDPVFPIANFSSNVTSGEAPFTVQFIDLSENADSWAWNFDGDGDVDDYFENPVYTYETAGNYTVNLTVSNVNGSNSTEKIDFIIVEVADDSGDTGDSGETGDSENLVSSSHRSGGNGVGSAKIIRKEKLEPVEESDLASGSNSQGENSEKSDEYKALKVQSDMANNVEASGSEQEDGGNSAPWVSLPCAVIGLVLVAYLMNGGKKR